LNAAEGMPVANQSAGQSLQRRRRVRNLAVLADLAPLTRLGERDRNRLLVHIEADVGDRPLHDPRLGAGSPGATLATCIL
jgi:hypothetical protein